MADANPGRKLDDKKGNAMLNTKGFTLIELMITVAIVGILAGIAYPSYQDSVRKSRRADAQGALLGFANAMERYFTVNNSYLGAPVDGGTPYYNLIISAAASNAYTLQATPINSQAGDGFMQISGTGVRGWDRNDDGDTLDANENSWD